MHLMRIDTAPVVSACRITQKSSCPGKKTLFRQSPDRTEFLMQFLGKLNGFLLIFLFNKAVIRFVYTGIFQCFEHVDQVTETAGNEPDGDGNTDDDPHPDLDMPEY